VTVDGEGALFMNGSITSKTDRDREPAAGKPSWKIDSAKIEQEFSLPSNAARARREGRSLVRQIKDIFSLSWHPNYLSIKEYYFYNLHRIANEDPGALKSFLGAAGIDKIAHRVGGAGRGVLDDKLVYYTVMASAGYRTPLVVAVFDRWRVHPGALALRGASDVAQFLRTTSSYPLVGKPVAGSRSIGITALDGYDGDTGTLVMRYGDRVPLDYFVGQIQHVSSRGYMFQEKLAPHPMIHEICGDRISTVRLVVALASDRPAPITAIWRIPAGRSVADNFWRGTNVIAGLDMESGRATHAVIGSGGSRRRIEVHPDTNAPIVGRVVPDWERAVATALEVSRLFSYIRIQAFDVAICESGPILLENNVVGEVNLSQLLYERGALTGPFREIAEELGALETPGTRKIRRLRRRWLARRRARSARDSIESP
jgi:hypothetical protein